MCSTKQTICVLLSADRLRYSFGPLVVHRPYFGNQCYRPVILNRGDADARGATNNCNSLIFRPSGVAAKYLFYLVRVCKPKKTWETLLYTFPLPQRSVIQSYEKFVRKSLTGFDRLSFRRTVLRWGRASRSFAFAALRPSRPPSLRRASCWCGKKTLAVKTFRKEQQQYWDLLNVFSTYKTRQEIFPRCCSYWCLDEQKSSYILILQKFFLLIL